MRHLKRFALASTVLGTALVACTADVSYEEGAAGGGPGWGETEDAGTILGDGAPSAEPMLAIIDPSASLTQTPGQGVGVFVQYSPTTPADPGGHWYIWWTCDTSLSGESCPFDITVSVAQGEITDATAQAFEATDSLTASASVTRQAGVDGGAALDGGVALDAGAVLDGGVREEAGASEGGVEGSSITAQTTTTTAVQGVNFTTSPGATITLSASLGGEYSGSFLFFVQDGKVNGGYTGLLTDPLELRPSSP